MRAHVAHPHRGLGCGKPTRIAHRVIQQFKKLQELPVPTDTFVNTSYIKCQARLCAALMSVPQSWTYTGTGRPSYSRCQWNVSLSCVVSSSNDLPTMTRKAHVAINSLTVRGVAQQADAAGVASLLLPCRLCLLVLHWLYIYLSR
jgi:hypothetical protein